MNSRSLQDELHRKQPFASLQQEAILSLLRTSDQLTNRLMRFFREHDLTLSQFNLLKVLQVEDRELTCGEIKQQMIHVVPAITGVVDRLEQCGLVVRTRCTEDRRVVYVRITKQGAALVEQATEPLRVLEQTCLAGMQTKDLKQMIGLLGKVRASLAAETES